MEYETLMEGMGLNDTVTLPLVLYAVILGPVCEEYAFRGLTMRYARRVMPFWTANVVQAVAFRKAALAVDTHVFRVSHRLGLVPASCTTPYSVEIALKKYIPEEKVAASHYWILLHGRYVCTARRPHCEKCGLAHLCCSKDKITSTLLSKK